ncbi:MAG: coproporphyrinogen dehydrogenase HemZ [Lachnospiraceae bacterium]|nr:coproporphyrinogen dehydrogenase HemZ [Lachnospiraceae bacterium]
MRQSGENIKINAFDPLMEDDILPLLHSFFPDGNCGGSLCISITGKTGGDVKVQVSFTPEDKTVKSVQLEEFADPERIRTGIDESEKAGKTKDISDVDENRIKFYSGESIYRREQRKETARVVYVMLERITGRSLPWGMLTGVRPTKLVLDRIEKGLGMHATYLTDRFCVTREKAALAVRVAQKEYKLLHDMDYKNGFSLYVGIPFCPSICNYCTFGSHPLSRFGDYVEPYLDALAREIAETSKFMTKRLDCVYVGGGTPTVLSPRQLERLIMRIRDNYDIKGAREFCVEAGRPDSITAEKLKVLRDCGVTRISINPQSMVATTLKTIGREHTPEQIVKAFEAARACGFDNINADIIAGLSGETPEDFNYTLSRIGELSPESLTVHTLSHKRAARITTSPEMYDGLEATGVSGMVAAGAKYACEHGMEPYYLYRQKNMTESLENIGYSLPGKECLYNILIMEERQMILALGAGASSKFVRDCAERFERVENVKSVRDYIERIDEMIARKRTYIEEYNIKV